MLSQLALMIDMQLVELSACMGHATDLGYACAEARLVARVIVADQFSGPAFQERTCMLTRTARREVIDHTTYGQRTEALDMPRRNSISMNR